MPKVGVTAGTESACGAAAACQAVVRLKLLAMHTQPQQQLVKTQTTDSKLFNNTSAAAASSHIYTLS